MDKGFTLVEVLVVGFIIGVLSTVILLNYRSGQEQASLTRAAAFFETDVRRAQNLAISSFDFGGTIPCGYGLHYLDDRTYSIYAGELGGALNCQASSHNFQSDTDLVYQSQKIIEAGVIFRSSFVDVFFEPPDPATYVDDSKSVGVSATVELCLEADLTKCRLLIIDTAGRISTQ